MASKTHFKKTGKKYRKRFGKKKMGKPSRGLAQSIYLFKRTYTQVVNLNDAALPTNWAYVPAQPPLLANGYVITWTFNLEELYNFTEFSSGLFNKYKINAIKTQIWSSANSTFNAATDNNQMLVYTLPFNEQIWNTPNTMTEQKCLETQSCRKELLIQGTPRPKKYYHKVKQAIVSSTPNITVPLAGQPLDLTPNTIYIKPRYCDCHDSTLVEHYGLCQRYQFINPALSTVQRQDFQFKILHTFYITMKGVV